MFEPCDMVCYPAGISYEKIGTQFINGWTCQQQYTGKIFSWPQSVLRKYLTLITLPPAAWTIITRQDHIYTIILILTFKWHRKTSKHPDQTFFPVFYCPILLNLCNISLSFLFLANRSGTWCGLLLLKTTCFQFWHV